MQENSIMNPQGKNGIYIVNENDVINKIMIKSDKKYEVEKIVDQRRDANQKLEYLVKWKSSLNFENSWEPFSFVYKAYSKVFEYELGLKAKDPNYKINEEVYYLYEKIRFDQLNKKEEFTQRDAAEILKIFKIEDNIFLLIKWKDNPLGQEYYNSYLRLSDCLFLPKVMKLYLQYSLKNSEFINN